MSHMDSWSQYCGSDQKDEGVQVMKQTGNLLVFSIAEVQNQVLYIYAWEEWGHSMHAKGNPTEKAVVS